MSISKVLVLGSGGLKIGEAGEFDYSGSQALKALREEGIETVLVNPNIATIQTDPRFADKVYLLPVRPYFVEKVIERERPDGILLGFGGQTALNCGVKLHNTGVFDRYGVKVLGTSIKAIETAEDRGFFAEAMKRADVPIPRSLAVTSIKEAKEIAQELGYPLMLRIAYALGGKGSGVAYNEFELEEILRKGIAASMIGQVLVEEYLKGWKEVEYEIVRDKTDNCIICCNMENFDPMGVHTGESIVIAPSQTLNNHEYHLLRSASIRIIQQLGIIGECNIQFALSPSGDDFRVIEVNPRLSRSSALASKATGYPLAYIAAKLALGYTLPELRNKVTGITTANFEPALDYVVVKIPRWDLEKFDFVKQRIGPQMKSVGEVMGIGRCFEEALQKAIRMLNIGKIGLVGNRYEMVLDGEVERIEHNVENPTDQRLFVIVKALKMGVSVDKIHSLSGIDRWFLYKIQNVVMMEELLGKIRPEVLDEEEIRRVLREAKRLGFSDKQIGICWGIGPLEVRELRKKFGIVPVINQIDTLAAEWPARTNYCYFTYGGVEDDIIFTEEGEAEGGECKKRVVVLGSGTYRIGSSVEFDWCAMNTVWALKSQGVDEVIVVNLNPETVSTDFDMADNLIFEELSLERVLDICDKVRPMGVVVSVGGQIPNTLAPKLADLGVKILGTSARDIDRAENRAKFSSLLEDLGIDQPPWARVSSLDSAEEFARKVGYPVLVRPSYVLSGDAMRVAHNKWELKSFLTIATSVSPEHPVVISKFIEDAKEVEVDGVADGEDVLIGAIIEHIEEAGVPSGDATMVIPPISVPQEIKEEIVNVTGKIARALMIRGPFNIQYLLRDGELFVIECNLRASRSMPYLSKTTGVNLMEIASSVMLGKKLRDIGVLETPKIGHYAVKSPQFSFLRLEGADPVLGVTMRSTGEVACFGETFEEALLKALTGAEFDIPNPKKSVLITVGGAKLKEEIIPIVQDFSELGFKILATEHTAEALKAAGIEKVEIVYKIGEPARKPNITELLNTRDVGIIVNIPQALSLDKYLAMKSDEYIMRRKAADMGVPVITNLQMAKAIVRALKRVKETGFSFKSLDEYHGKLPFTYWPKEIPT